VDILRHEVKETEAFDFEFVAAGFEDGEGVVDESVQVGEREGVRDSRNARAW
jgi:hypothetical protein